MSACRCAAPAPPECIRDSGGCALPRDSTTEVSSPFPSPHPHWGQQGHCRPITEREGRGLPAPGLNIEHGVEENIKRAALLSWSVFLSTGKITDYVKLWKTKGCAQLSWRLFPSWSLSRFFPSFPLLNIVSCI